MAAIFWISRATMKSFVCSQAWGSIRDFWLQNIARSLQWSFWMRIEKSWGSVLANFRGRNVTMQGHFVAWFQGRWITFVFYSIHVFLWSSQYFLPFLMSIKFHHAKWQHGRQARFSADFSRSQGTVFFQNRCSKTLESTLIELCFDQFSLSCWREWAFYVICCFL